MMHNLYVGTREYLIKIQDVIIKQVGEFSETNKRARCNKIRPCRLESFQKSIVKNSYGQEKFHREGCNKTVQGGIFKRIIKTCCMFIKYSRVHFHEIASWQ